MPEGAPLGEHGEMFKGPTRDKKRYAIDRMRIRRLFGNARALVAPDARRITPISGNPTIAPTMAIPSEAGYERGRRSNSSPERAERLDGTVAVDERALQLHIYHSFEAAETIWRSIEDECYCHVFQTFDWLATWYRTIGAAEHIEPCIVCVADAGGKSVMLLPLGIHRQFGVSFLTFLGGIVSDYHAPIVEAKFAATLDAASFAEMLSRIFAQLPRADVLALERMPASLDGVRNPFAYLPRAKHVWSAHMAVLGTSFEDFKRRRSAKIFLDSKRQWRRLSEIAPTRLEIAATPSAIAEMLDALARQKRRRWRETGARDLFGISGYLAFYQMLANRFVAPGLIHLSALRVGDTIVATHLGAVFRSRFYYLMPGFESGDWVRFSVGRLLMQSLLEWGISAGLSEFDLTVGDEIYKDKWADQSVPLYNCMRGLTVRGRVYCLCLETRERIRACAKRSGPLRSIARRLRGTS
jgi:CelD/BcsL family acetyltransferase involved in cellulose biosynthesis